MIRPYIVIPKIVKQPTWGGDYILKLKKWQGLKEYSGEKIGQSFELSGDSMLASSIYSTKDSSFSPFSDGVSVQSFVTKKMPLLIKINQALGNSFQLHIKPEVKFKNWLPKPETWYFLEDGNITLGLNENKNIEEYKKTCLEINSFMEKLNQEIFNGSLKLDEARNKAQKFIYQKDPWQFVNSYIVKRGMIIDLSEGAIHHSWEDNKEKNSLGNIVFEVQIDASDDKATIRSFDQGKIQDDGNIRKLNIDDYFSVIDTNKERNKLQYHLKQLKNGVLIRTKFYAVDSICLKYNEKFIFDRIKNDEGSKSFHHFFVEEGEVEVLSENNISIEVTTGHSFFIPESLNLYKIVPKTKNAKLLKTFLPN